jgi:signal transduction histidine kinase
MKPSTTVNRFSDLFADLFHKRHLGESRAQVSEAIHLSQMRSLPFIYGSVAFLFVAYSLIQAVFLKEPGSSVMVGVGLASALFLFGMWLLLRRSQFTPQRAEWLAALLALVILLSIQLRFFLTAEAKQAANLALFVFAMSVLFFATRWFLLMMGLAFVNLLYGLFVFASGEDWQFYVVVFLAAAATGLIAHVGRVLAYRRTELLRLQERQQREENARLYAEVRQLNQQLEAKVARRTLALQEAYSRLEKLDKTKTDFITIASHEFLTPLTIINLNAQQFMDDPLIRSNQQYAGWARGIDRGVVRLQEVVGSLLDVARIDSEALQLQVAPLDLNFLLRQVGNQFRAPLTERKLTLRLESLADLPEVEADHEALQKVFYQLLMNAVKYTPDGGEIVINGRSTHHHHQPAIEITIADSGIGIDPVVQPFIFDKFFQTGEVMLHSSGKTKFKGGGSGLGLAIVQGIVIAHNGRVWVESDGLDEANCPGSRFHVLLPCKKQLGVDS